MAEAWEDMNDIQRASALELMGGKRQANVLSALIQNFDTVESVIETSANSAGSALKENERYLDSIQGKIDQFNNAMQAMWSNTLDSGWVKGFVELATQLVKIVDAIGPLNIALVGFFTYLEKKHGVLSNFFKPAEDGVEALKKQLAKAEQDLAKATQADMQHGSKKTAQNRRDAEERVAILKSKIQESSSEAILDGIDESFDPGKVKKSIGGKKGAITKRAKKLESEGMSFAQIQEDPKIKQWTQEVKEGEQALNDYNAKVVQADVILKQKNATTAQAAGVENAKAGAEAGDAVATNAGTVADANATTATTTKTAATWADIWAEMTRTGATGASVAATIKQVLATKLANSALVQKGLAIMGVTAAEGASIPVTTMLAGGFVGLASSIWSAITAMWTFMTTTPIGWILLAVGAVVALGAAFSAIHKTTEELKEELDGFKSELSDVRSELDSVNSELETTNKRMEELLAKDKLTFEEQEELDRLRATNDELERRKKLLESEEEYKTGLVGRQAARVVDSTKNNYDFWESILPVVRHFKTTAEEDVKNNIDDYKKIKEKFDNASTLIWQEEYQKQLDAKAAEIDKYILELSEALDGVEYGDSEESDAALDYLAELQDTYGIARGSASAETNAIKGVFNKPEFESMSKAINYYVEALKDGDENAATSIEEIINNNEDLVADLEAHGVDADKAIKYWTQLGSDANFSTLEGKTEEIKRATEKLPDAFNNISQFMDGDEVDKTAIAEYFKGTSDKTREEIAKLIQDINDGKIDVNNALKKFELFGVQSVVEIEISEVQTNFKDTFTDLENADGLINTFQELADAIGSTSKAMDALNAAQAEMDYSGRVSIETALKLMESTDDYSKVLTISEGKLVLAEDAEENLIDARLEGMKASALKALEEAKAARETTVLARSTAETALSTYNSAIETEMAAAVTATAWDKVLAAAAGLWAGIKSLFTDESWTEAYDRAYQETLNSLGGDRAAEVKAKYATAEEQAKKAQLEKDIENADKAIAEQDKEIEKLQGNYDLVSGLNKDNIGDVFKSDDLEDPEDAEKKKQDDIKDGWEALLSKYENQLALLSNERDLIQAEIDKAETQGGKASTKYYDDLIDNSNTEKELLIQKKAALEEYLTANAGAIDQDTWTDYNNEINATAVAIKECEINTIEWEEAIREIDLHYFEQITDEISRLGEELDFVNSLLEDEEVADENGNWSSAALTRMGLYTQQMEKAATEAAMYQDELDKVNEQYKNGELSEEQYQEKLSNLVSGQQDAIESYKDAKDSIVEMNEARIDAIREGIEKEIEAYEDLIDAKKEELDAERDLYDFRKNIKNQTKEISELERRIASLSGSSAASDIAERRKLEAQLMEAKEGLNDTYYDHSRDAQSQALDEESEAFALSKERYIEQLEEQLKDTQTLIENSIMDVMLNADIVYTELNELADLYGIDLSDSLTLPWKNASAQAIKWKDELKESMTAGEYAALIGEGGAITGFANGVAAKLQGSWSKAQTAAKNYAGYLTGTELKNKFTNTLTGFGSQIQSIIDKWNGVKAAADAAYTAQTREVTVGGTGSNTTGDSDSGSGGGGGSTTPPTKPTIPKSATAYLKIGNTVYSAIGSGTSLSLAQTAATGNVVQKAYNAYKAMGYDDSWIDKRYSTWKKNVTFTKPPVAVKSNANIRQNLMYAKGTTGTTRDQWAITDEPKFGDELTMYATPEGTLSFMRAGSTVIPADLTRELIDLPKVVDGLINRPKFDSGINMIANAINKPEIVIDVENFLKVDRVDKDSLPQLEAMMDKKIDTFARQLNYSIKKFSR